MQSAEGKAAHHRENTSCKASALIKEVWFLAHTAYRTWTQCSTNLVGCMLSCYCHWCRCHYCSNWCCSPCDWHMHSANCLAATAGSEAHPCREGQVCNKEGHRTVNQNLLLLTFLSWARVDEWGSSLRAVTHLPLVLHRRKCIPLVGLYITQRNKNITHLPALHADSPLWYATAERSRKTLNLDELSKRGSAKGTDVPWNNS